MTVKHLPSGNIQNLLWISNKNILYSAFALQTENFFNLIYFYKFSDVTLNKTNLYTETRNKY